MKLHIFLDGVKVATVYNTNILSLFFEEYVKIVVFYKRQTVYSWRNDIRFKEEERMSLIQERIKDIDLIERAE